MVRLLVLLTAFSLVSPANQPTAPAKEPTAAAQEPPPPTPGIELRIVSPEPDFYVSGPTLLKVEIVPSMLATRVAQKLWRGHTEAGESEITVPSAPVNGLLTALVLAEASLARLIPMPFGSSLRVLARKPCF